MHASYSPATAAGRPFKDSRLVPTNGAPLSSAKEESSPAGSHPRAGYARAATS